MMNKSVYFSKFVSKESLESVSIPSTIEDIDNSFLGKALGATVVSFEQVLCEAGQTSTTVLCKNIVYDVEEGVEKPPTSVAVKIHSAGQDVRNFALTCRLYEREVKFYSSFRPHSLPFMSPEPYAIISSETYEFFVIVMSDMNADGWVAYDSNSDSNQMTFDDLATITTTISNDLYVPWLGKKDIIDKEHPFLSVGQIGDTYEAFLRSMPQIYPLWKKYFAETPTFDQPDFGGRGANGLPSRWAPYLEVLELLLVDNNMDLFVKRTNQIWSSRDLTLRHGDMNNGNVRYRKKEDGTKEFIFHDFQFIQLATIGMDFVSLFCTTPIATTDNGQDIKLMKIAIDTLKEKYPNFNYTLQQCIDDMLMNTVSFLSIVTALMVSQYHQKDKIAESKFNYAWNALYPSGFDWALGCFVRNGGVSVIKSIIDGTYTTFSV